MQHAATWKRSTICSRQVRQKEKILKRVEKLREENPMLGLRGVRLGIHIPELTTMQVRAIFRGRLPGHPEGIDVHPRS
jgi:pyruvate,orthophosphate dikinase